MGYKKLFSFYYFIHFSVNLKQTKKTEVKYNLFKRKEEGKREGKKRQDGGKVAERKKNERERGLGRQRIPFLYQVSSWVSL